MKRKLALLLSTLIVLTGLVGGSSFADSVDPVQFVLDSASYLDNQTKLEVSGHIINVGTRPVTDVVEMPVEIYDGNTLVASGVYKKETAGTMGINVGDIEKISFTLATPVQWLKLTDVKCTSRVVYNSGEPANLPVGKKVYYNGTFIEYDVKPALVSGRLMVPARATFEKMGAKVDWNAESRAVTVIKGNRTVVLIIGNELMNTNDKPIKLDVPAQIIDGRTLVPLRAISSALGDKIFYGAESEVAVIYSAN